VCLCNREHISGASQTALPTLPNFVRVSLAVAYFSSGGIAVLLVL